MEVEDSVVDPLRNPDLFVDLPPTTPTKEDEKIAKDDNSTKVESKAPTVIPPISEELLQKIFRYSSLLAEPGSKTASGSECEEFWSDFFETHFKTNKTWMSITDDDLLYYVKKGLTLLYVITQKGADMNMFALPDSNTKTPKSSNQDKFFVKRFDAKGFHKVNAFVNNLELPAKNDPNIDWECTQMLNVLLHHYQYTVEVSVRTKNPATRYQFLHCNSDLNLVNHPSKRNQNCWSLKKSQRKFMPFQAKFEWMAKYEIALDSPNFFYRTKPKQSNILILFYILQLTILTRHGKTSLLPKTAN